MSLVFVEKSLGNPIACLLIRSFTAHTWTSTEKVTHLQRLDDQSCGLIYTRFTHRSETKKNHTIMLINLLKSPPCLIELERYQTMGELLLS